MSDEVEARMWMDEQNSRYDGQGIYYESAFASSEHLDRAPLLSDETYTEVTVAPSGVTNEHCHWKSKPDPPSAVPQLVIALVLCGFFMVCELIGGYLACSLSVMCDAAHMLSDCGGFALALLAFHCAKRKPDTTMSYGYKRAEVLGAMVSVLLIWVLTGVFVYLAAVRLYSGDYDIEPDTMIVVSGSGVLFNIVMAIVLHGCGSSIAHHHTHGGAPCTHTAQPSGPSRTWLQRLRSKKDNKHSSNGTVANGINADYTMKEFNDEPNVVSDSQGRNINHRAALIHVIGDLIQSCGVLIASIVIKIYPAAKFVDPLCTFVFSILVLVTTAKVVKDALSMLMQAVPKDFRYRACVAMLSSVSGVRHIHSLHVWPLSTHHIVLSAHVAIDDLTDPDLILRSCQDILRKEFNVQSATLQVERYTEDMRQCDTCLEQPALRT